MGNKLRTATTAGLLSVVLVSCGGNEAENSPTKQTPTATTEKVAPPLEKTPPPERVVGKRALSGCNIKKAKVFLRKRVIDERPFRANVVTDEEGNEVLSHTRNSDGDLLTRPLALRCKGKNVALAAISKALKATEDNDYDPVRTAPFDRGSDTIIYSLNNPNGIGSRVRTLRFERKTLEQYGPNVATPFYDEQGQKYAIAIDKGDKPVIPPSGTPS